MVGVTQGCGFVAMTRMVSVIKGGSFLNLGIYFFSSNDINYILKILYGECLCHLYMPRLNCSTCNGGNACL